MAAQQSFWPKFHSEPEKGTVRFPLGQIIVGAYLELVEHFKSFFYIGSAYAAVMALLYLLCGQTFFCTLSDFGAPQICSFNPIIYLACRLAALWLAGAFCVRYYQSAWQGQPLSLRFIFKPQWTDLKTLAAFIIYLLINGMAFLSWRLLIIREPNPDWRIELTYFGVVSIGFWLPFVLLRFYAVLANIWGNQKMPSLWKMWKQTRGNTLRLLLGMSMCLFGLIFGISTVITNLGFKAGDNPRLIILVGEYVYDWVMLLMMGCFVNFCAIQKIFLDKENENGEVKND